RDLSPRRPAAGRREEAAIATVQGRERGGGARVHVCRRHHHRLGGPGGPGGQPEGGDGARRGGRPGGHRPGGPPAPAPPPRSGRPHERSSGVASATPPYTTGGPGRFRRGRTRR